METNIKIEYKDGSSESHTFNGDGTPVMKFRDLRKNKGFTQKSLSEKSGINIRQIQKIESGEINIENISLKNAISLSMALNISVEELIKL